MGVFYLGLHGKVLKYLNSFIQRSSPKMKGTGSTNRHQEVMASSHMSLLVLSLECAVYPKMYSLWFENKHEEPVDAGSSPHRESIRLAKLGGMRR